MRSLPVVLMIAVVAMLYAARRHNWQDEPTPSRWMISQVTFDPVLAGEPSWSPDGRFLAYSSDRNGNFTTSGSNRSVRASQCR